MIKEKGIFTKLLAVFGAVLVISGVFVFQNGSRADDTTAPADTAGIGLQAGDLTEPESEAEPTEPTEPTEPVEPETNAFSVEYYTEAEVLNEETGEVEIVKTLVLKDEKNISGTEATFAVTDVIPDGEGEFIHWYDRVNEKAYNAADGIILNIENPKLELIAKFDVERNFALEYDVNGGTKTVNSQVCVSHLDTCDFTISSVVPEKEGYEFKGWQKASGDDTMIYAPGASIRSRSYLLPLKLKAVWAEIRTYTLMFEGNGGSGVPVTQECKSANGSCKFKVPDIMPVRNSFEFMNWQKGIEVVMPGTEIIVTETTTILVANWNPITIFTLEYIAEDVKDIPEPARCETFMGTCTFVITDKVPEKEGYVFRGWRLEGKDDMLAKAGDQLEVGVDGPLDLKIFAVWSKIYPILNSGEVFGVGERVILRTAADFGGFKDISIDEELISGDYFKISEGGGTSVTLSNAFSQALSAGEHAFKITWEGGEANGIISVNQNEDGTKRFVVVDASSSTDGASLMFRPKAGAVSKESTKAVVDSAKDNGENNFDAVRTLIIVAVAVFVAIYLVNKFYIRRKMEFIEEFD